MLLIQKGRYLHAENSIDVGRKYQFYIYIFFIVVLRHRDYSNANLPRDESEYIEYEDKKISWCLLIQTESLVGQVRFSKQKKYLTITTLTSSILKCSTHKRLTAILSIN